MAPKGARFAPARSSRAPAHALQEEEPIQAQRDPPSATATSPSTTPKRILSFLVLPYTVQLLIEAQGLAQGEEGDQDQGAEADPDRPSRPVALRHGPPTRGEEAAPYDEGGGGLEVGPAGLHRSVDRLEHLHPFVVLRPGEPAAHEAERQHREGLLQESVQVLHD